MIKPPSDRWAVTTLGHVVDILDSKRVPVKKTDRDKRPGNVPYYGATGLAGWIDKPIFNEELLLLGEDGAPFLDPAKPKSYIIRGPAWVNNHAHVLRAVDSLTSNKFLKYQLDWTPYSGHVTGTTRLKLTQRAMRQLPILLPGKTEQERIVAAIEEHFSRLDAVEASAVAARRRLDALRNSIMDRAFYSNANSELTAEIGDLAEVSGGIQKQPKRRPLENRYPFLRVANVGRGHLDLAEVHEIELFEGEIDRFRLKRGDLLVVEGNGSVNQIGRAALWGGQIEDCVHQNHLIRVRPGESLLPEYLTLCWNAPRTAQQIQAVASSTSGLYTLSTSKVKSIRIPVVPLSVQRSAVEQLKQQLRSIEMAHAAAEDASGRVSALRRAILAQAFSGQLVPQNPNDEPAYALLERIANADHRDRVTAAAESITRRHDAALQKLGE